MRGTTATEELLFDPEIEKTIRKNRSLLRKKKAMEDVPQEIRVTPGNFDENIITTIASVSV